jgi:hypothetical protein
MDPNPSFVLLLPRFADKANEKGAKGPRGRGAKGLGVGQVPWSLDPLTLDPFFLCLIRGLGGEFFCLRLCRAVFLPQSFFRIGSGPKCDLQLNSLGPGVFQFLQLLVADTAIHKKLSCGHANH